MHVEMNGQDSQRAGFWRRLASTWVDLFVVYAITRCLIALTSIPEVRISFGLLFVVVGAVYSAVMLARNKQTIGNMLLQTVVVSKAANGAETRCVLLREVFGKWGVTVALPIMVGRLLVGAAWMPTVFEMLVLILVALVCLPYYAIARRMWYDVMAGTAVERASVPPKHRRLAFYALLGAANLAIGTMATEYAVKGWLPCRLSAYQSTRSTFPHVAFLERQHPGPVDYVIGLFDRYHVVVLCERAHPEARQWDFIYDVVRDPRFINRVGHVFTEYGQVGMQAYLDDFMAAANLTDPDIHDRAVHVMRNLGVWAIWNNNNFYTYLTRLYRLNQTLPPSARVRHHFTDAAIDWPGITKEKYATYRENCLWHRDEIMARTVIDTMNSLAGPAAKRPKCLVVMNYRHGMDLTDRQPGAERRNTYEYIKDAFGDHSANVLLNTSILASGVPVAGGVWDAAFDRIGNKPLGFDLAGSPFGIEPFDMYPFNPSLKHRLRYREVFTGFVFTHPTRDHLYQFGIPGYFAGFETEAVRRAGCVSDEHRIEVADSLQRANRGRISSADRFPSALQFQTYVELTLLGLAGVGWLIGVSAFAFNRRNRQDTG